MVMLLALVTSFQIFSSFVIHQLSYFAAVLSEILIQNLPQKIILFSAVDIHLSFYIPIPY